MFFYKKVIESISREKLKWIEKETKVNYKVSKLTGENIFNVLLYSVLEKSELSLRTIEENYKRLLGEKTRHSSIASRLESIPVEFFKEIFQHLVEKIEQSREGKKLRIIDSTTFQLSSKLLKFGIACRQTAKGQKNMIKCVVMTNGKLVKSLDLYTQSQGSSDEKTFRSALLSDANAEMIYLFDRGMKKRQSFVDFADQSLQFITRANHNIIYHKIADHEPLPLEKEGELILKEDSLVNLFGKGARKPFPMVLRLIRAIHIKDGKELIFLTSIKDLSAGEICEIYKERWSIEVFFRFIKQELNARHFLGRKVNAIHVTLYMVLIAALLILEYQRLSQNKSYKFSRRAFMHELSLEILKPIIAFCGGDPEKVYHFSPLLL